MAADWPTRPPAPRTIVLVVLDDVPRNAFSAYGASHGLSPILDGLAHDGLTFTHAFSTSPLCTPARFALLTGRFASNASSITAHRPWNLVGFNTFLTGREQTLAHHLDRAGCVFR
jgi:arylsulfatase A-like enzyme